MLYFSPSHSTTVPVNLGAMVECFSEEVVVSSPVFRGLYVVLVGALIWIVALTGVPAGPDAALLGVAALIVALPLLFGRLRIITDGRTLRISFGYLGWIKHEIPLAEIDEAEVVTYRPLRDFGGWGIRCGKFQGRPTACYSLRGNRGVLLTLQREIRVCLRRTRWLLIGCDAPERVREAIAR